MRKLGRGLGWILAIALVLGVAARVFFVDVWTVPEDPAVAASLAPSLRGGDVVLLLRGAAGFGELTRCADPEDATKWVVGRVAGRERDKIETFGRDLIINDKRYDGESACREPTITIQNPTTGADEEIHCDEVMMGGGWHYRGYSIKPQLLAKRTITDVGAGMLYLVSDDRTYPDDSRSYGTVPAASCKGRIFFRLWSKAGFGDDKARFSYIR